MPESSKPTSIQLMLRLLGLECRTARSSIYSEKAEIKSPENFCCLERRHPCLLGALRKRMRRAERSRHGCLRSQGSV